ncbi:cytochrome c oxidase subunit 3 [Achromobacter aloeverae]|uniref:Heme-copper oxidase subunit III family profile domain-containing protein n=1 Tax=Achromobacter aloeverae TaxID=1750518 RepID=A0A4Q1HMU1_9BURK|nr:cytochrome c oxidase subunit 3 [Achromobacter aloeverae]RXN92302.1 hypothetical protein C7R54_00610 [Achromobacter aloeverae]
MSGATLSAPDVVQAYKSRLAMWVFLASELMFFGPVFLAYAIGRFHHPEAFATGSRLTDVALGTTNTMVLLSSSAAIALAVEYAHAGAQQGARRLLRLTLFLGGVFLAIKGYEYANDLREGLFPNADFRTAAAGGLEGVRLFFFVYFVATGMHAVHMMVGLSLVSYMLVTGSHNPGTPWARRLEIVGLYWHFVDAVWVFLFPVLYLAGRAS